MKVKQLKFIISFIFISGQLLACPSVKAQDDYERKPVLRASEILPATLLKGPDFRVLEEVRNDGYMNTYLLSTTYGDLEVEGTYFLIKRISELGPIKYLDENYGSVTVAAQGAGEVARGIVTGPVKGAQKLYDNVSDTDKLKKTVKSIPSGIAGLVKVAAHGIGEAADYAYEAGKSAFSSDSSGSGSDDKLAKAQSYVEEKALDFVGYNDAYRDLARVLEVDPYTLNSVLHSELKRVATVKASVKVGSKFTPSLYGIPGVGKANKYLGYAQKTATYKDPKELEELDNKMLEALGQKKGNGHELDTESIMKNTMYSPPMRHELLKLIDALYEIPNAEMLLVQASKASSRYVANFYLQAIGKLVELKKSHAFTSIIPDIILPAALTSDGNLLIPLPVDHLVWTSEVAKIFRYFKGSVLRTVDKATVTVLLAGTISPRCRTELMNLGASEIVEKVPFIQ